MPDLQSARSRGGTPESRDRECRIVEVVVFHSAADRLRKYQADLPFAVVADPERKLYWEFGVESLLRSLFYADAAAPRSAAYATTHRSGVPWPREKTTSANRPTS
ncbi:hypothetical protein [Mycobacterium sp.]|uniref:hypothetical protein n=1 Tax=Mycobacterium sp. TaxID=1785 RepID=UPI002B72E5B3|nr:hypothetical protein [Mycobacterium sp.]HTQ22844.1 hypothetical protein [Mycobacterium sp.]